MKTMHAKSQRHLHRAAHDVMSPLARRRSLCMAVVLGLGLVHTASAWAAAADAAPPSGADAGPASIEFDNSFFGGGSSGDVDISRFSHGAVVMAGTYTVDVNVNEGNWSGQNTITFRTPDGAPEANAAPCFTRDMLTQWGVDLAKVDAERAKQADNSTQAVPAAAPVCASLDKLVPDASAKFDPSELSMAVSIPQLYLNRRRGNWVDPSQWQQGINVAFADYDFSSYSNRARGISTTDAFLSLNTGLNLDGWRFRQLGGVSWSDTRGARDPRYHSSAAYAQHDLTRLRSQLTVGDYSTSGQVFDAVPFRGVNIASDDRMLPDGDMGFAPVIRGVANTNAKVTVRQHGQLVYQTSVAPGPFALTDLPTLGGSGNLDITITEADGTSRTMRVPYSYNSNLLRPGVSRYSVSAGTFKVSDVNRRAPMVEATYQRGLNNLVTAYGGITGSTDYAAAAAGAAFNTPVGALSADLSTAHTKLPYGAVHTGQSLHVSYLKSFTEGTNLSFGAYRYSTRGYYSLNQAESARYAFALRGDMNSPAQRSQVDVNINQSLGRYGAFSLQGSDVSYWGSQAGQLTFGATYSNSFFHNNLNLQFSVQRTLQVNSPATDGRPPLPFFMPSAATTELGNRSDTQVMLTASIPLGRVGHAPTFNTSFTHDTHGGSSFNTGVSGSAGANSQWGYNATMQHSQGSNGYNAGAQYQGSKANVTGNVGHSAGANQASLDVEGSVVAFSHGVILGPSLSGDSFAIVHAAGAKGAKVMSSTNSHLDGRGYAVVPSLSSYRRNEVDLDPQGLPLNVDLQQTSRYATPRAGAAVLLEFATHAGGRAVVIDASALHAIGEKAQPIPFGSDVLDAQGNVVGVVGQNSRILARNLPDSGTLTVQWGDQNDQRCMIDYRLPAVAKNSASSAARYEHVHANCMVGAVFTQGDGKSTPAVTQASATDKGATANTMKAVAIAAKTSDTANREQAGGAVQ